MAIDLTGKTAPSVILLKGEHRKSWDERIAGGTIKPGHLIIPSSATECVVHATAGGYSLKWVADIDPMNQGHGISDAYSSGDRMFYHECHPGDRLYVRVAASATAIAAGDKLSSAGDGTFKKAGGSDVVLATAFEALDNSAGITEAFVRADF